MSATSYCRTHLRTGETPSYTTANITWPLQRSQGRRRTRDEGEPGTEENQGQPRQAQLSMVDSVSLE